MINMAFTISSLIFNAILFVFFFSKPKLSSKENEIFSRILICSLIGIIIEVFSFILVRLNLDETNTLYVFTNKLILMYYAWWGTLFAIYIGKISNHEKFNLLYNKIIIILSIILIICPLSFIKQNELIIPSGISVYLIYLMSIIYIIISVFFMLKEIKKDNIRKYIPLIGLIIFGFIIVFVQLIYPQLLLLSFVHTIIIYLVYFTLENPDLYLIKELTQTKNYLEQSNVDKNNFICDVSTEMNNKIDELENNLKSINKTNMNQKVKECLDILSLSKNELLNVLDISSMDANKLKLTNTSYDVENLIKSVYLKYKKLVPKNVDYRLSINELPLRVYGDSIKVKQILSSLIDNSIKNTKDGFIELKVNAIIKYDVCKLIFTLEDSCDEMDYDYLYYLLNYENLLTDKDIKNKDKAEINLNIIKKMVNLMGGTFNIQNSNKGKGSKIIITINQKMVERLEEKSNKYDKFTEEYKEIKSVCLISKKEENEKIIKSVCKKKKFNYLYFDETKKCLDLLRKNEKYDFICIDEDMEKINAFRFLNKCKEIQNFDSKIFVITEKKDMNSKTYLLNNGFNSVITEPIKKKSLEELFDEFI